MNAVYAAVVLTADVMTGGPCRSEPAHRALALEVAADHVTLACGDMSVRTSPGRLQTHVRGPFGHFGTDGLNLPLGEIRVEQDTVAIKTVSLVSKVEGPRPQGVMTLRMTARADAPGIELRVSKQNAGDQPIRAHFFFRLTGLKFPYYHDPDGWQYAGKPDLPAADWLFLPSANSAGGYGLIPLYSQASRIGTLYPRKDWQAVGLYFIPRGSHQMSPGETRSVGFIIFPATSPWGVEDAMRALPAGTF